MSRDKNINPIKVCILQPDYTGTDIHYGDYDPRRDLNSLLPHAEVDYLFLKKATVFKQLRLAAQREYDIFINLCEGYLDWEIPSIDVIWFLERLRLPYTGAPAHLYDPSKELMKYVAYVQGVSTPKFIETQTNEINDLHGLKFPLFVKPAHAGDSLGIDLKSLVTTKELLVEKVQSIVEEFGSALIEEYVDGREFTVLLVANPLDRTRPTVLQPIEFLFPSGKGFKTYDLKITMHHPECNVPVLDSELDLRIREAARQVFIGFGGEGYARLDFRMDQSGTLYFLDINFACSLFYNTGSEGSADYIMRMDPLGASGFLQKVIDEGLFRHQKMRRLWVRKSRSTFGYGIFAVRDIEAGEIIFPGEEEPIRLVSRGYLEQHWTSEEREIAQHYAIPYSEELLAIWNKDPIHWAPQNHSCNPNTAYLGLDVVALKFISKDKELTLDYGQLYNENNPAFTCTCGEVNCRQEIRGVKGFSLTAKFGKRRGQSID